MTETADQPEGKEKPGTQLAPSRDQTLSMAASKLAGSPACLNCGTELKGPFCYFCGQPDRNFMRFFPALLREFLSDFLELDSRFVRTMKPLLFQPGRLTRDFLEGRRFRYTPPMRLYIFSSLAFFILAASMSASAIKSGHDPNNPDSGPLIRVTPDDGETIDRAVEALDRLPENVREQTRLQLETAKARQQASKAADENAQGADLGEPEPQAPQPPDADQVSQKQDGNQFSTDDIQFNDKPWNRETNPVDLPWVPAAVNDWINDTVENSPKKAEEINRNPNLIVEKIFDILPATMFVLLPVVALLFKFWYLFAKRYYVEHLIFALHNHAFLFVSLLLILLINIITGSLSARGVSAAREISPWLITIISVWIPLYLLISLRHVYRQSWFLTLCKFGVIGISYVSLLGIVTSIVAIMGFVLL